MIMKRETAHGLPFFNISIDPYKYYNHYSHYSYYDNYSFFKTV